MTGQPIERMTLAVPGPVHTDPVMLTNIRWQFSRDALKSRFNVAELVVVNDFQAAALGAVLEPYERLKVLNAATPDDGPVVVAGAGTGLGMAWLPRNTLNGLPQATEGGHIDFAPLMKRRLFCISVSPPAMAMYPMSGFSAATVWSTPTVFLPATVRWPERRPRSWRWPIRATRMRNRPYVPSSLFLPPMPAISRWLSIRAAASICAVDFPYTSQTGSTQPSSSPAMRRRDACRIWYAAFRYFW